jgi:uncharacterized protein YggU (UPF0235/DUF167 family)
VIELVAKALGVARAAVTITAGHSSRRKSVAVRGVDASALAKVVEA